MRYVFSLYKNRCQELAYRIYITDSLQALGQGKYLKTRYADIITPREIINPLEADGYARNVLYRAGIEVKSTDANVV